MFFLRGKDEKRIIRIKDLESNCIEEMIVILKNDTKKLNGIKYKVLNNYDNFIITEAERILDDYIKNNFYDKHIKKYFEIKLNTLLNYLLILSIIFVGYMIFKFW